MGQLAFVEELPPLWGAPVLEGRKVVTDLKEAAAGRATIDGLGDGPGAGRPIETSVFG
jgi:hypothetical protein